MIIVRICALIVLTVSGLIAFRHFLAEPTSVPIENVRQVPVVAPDEASGVAVELEAAQASVAIDESDACMTMNQLEAHPSFTTFSKSFEPLLIDDPAIESFRHVDKESVAQFAEQGDSAAMLVMGAAAVMRALGQNESGAVDWLRSDSWTPKGNLTGRQFSATSMLELNDAAYWFYEAAMHGRLFALGKYGEVRGIIFGGPVGLGWIGSEEYEAMDSMSKAILDPMNLHNALALDLVPELSAGAASVFFDEIPQNELQKEIRADLQREFSQSLSDANLVLNSVSPSTSDEFEDAIRRSCLFLKLEEPTAFD